MKIEMLTSYLYARFSDSPLPHTIKGVAATNDNDVYGICAVTRIEGTNFVIFGEKEGLGKRDIIRGWKALTDTFKEGEPYYTLMEENIETAPSMLKHFNFTHFVDDIYIYGGN